MSTRVETSETITADKRVETITRIDDKRITEEVTKIYSSNIPGLDGTHLVSTEYTTHKYLTRCPDVLLKTSTQVDGLLVNTTKGSENPSEATNVTYISRQISKREIENDYDDDSGRYILKSKKTTETENGEPTIILRDGGGADSIFLFSYTNPQTIATVEQWSDLGDGLTRYKRVKTLQTYRVGFTPSGEEGEARVPSGIIPNNILEIHESLSYDPPPTATCRGSGKDADEEPEEEPREDLEREKTEPTARASTANSPNDAPRPSTYPIVSNPGDPNNPFGSSTPEDGSVVPTPSGLKGNDNETDLDKKQGMPGKRSPRQVKEDAVDLTGARGVPILPKAATTGIERVTSPLLTMCTMDDRRAVRTLAAQIEQEAMYARKGASVTVSERQRGMAGFVWGDDVKRVGIEASEYITLTVEREGQ